MQNQVQDGVEMNGCQKLVQLHWIGRLGNRMFQYAFGCQYANDMRVKFYFPSRWEGSLLFEPYRLAEPISDSVLDSCLRTCGGEGEEEQRKRCLSLYNSESGDDVLFVDLHDEEAAGKDGEAYSNRAFDDLSMMYMRYRTGTLCTSFLKEEVFRFSSLVKGTQMYSDLESRKGTYSVAHVRRGDIAEEGYRGAHSCVTLDSYRRFASSLGIREDSIVWICEDPSVASDHRWRHKGGDNGWEYPEGQRRLGDDGVLFDFLPDFLTIHFAGVVLRGNSSFSWWAAELSDSAKVYSPVVEDRPEEMVGPNWVECEFVEGNAPHFMGARFDPILPGKCDKGRGTGHARTRQPGKVVPKFLRDGSVHCVAMVCIAILILVLLLSRKNS